MDVCEFIGQPAEVSIDSKNVSCRPERKELGKRVGGAADAIMIRALNEYRAPCLSYY